MRTTETQTTTRGWNRASTTRSAYHFVFAAVGLILLVLFIRILVLNHGVFTYTLDDPYIHLALSDQIRHGNYGINAGLHAAPSSSILFPFLLVPFAGMALHQYVPLILNVAALFISLEIIRRFLGRLRLVHDTFAAVVVPGVLLLMAICSNMIGVVFTGLEHSLHVAASIVIIYGLTILVERNEVPKWLPAFIKVKPRYQVG